MLLDEFERLVESAVARQSLHHAILLPRVFALFNFKLTKALMNTLLSRSGCVVDAFDCSDIF